MKKLKPLSLRTQLKNMRIYAEKGWDDSRKVSRALDEMGRELARFKDTAERNALRVAHLEGYIKRVHEIERGEPVQTQKRGDPVSRLREIVANGPEEGAQAILDALDEQPDTMDAILGRRRDEERTDIASSTGDALRGRML